MWMNRNRLKGIYAITDPDLMGAELLQKSEQAILGGINILQYRNKTATLSQQENEARTLAELCKKHNVLFIINDNVELAIHVNADGVHLGQTDTHIEKARELLGKNKIIGVTCNNKIELASTAQQQGADYVAFGRFFNSNTKPSAPAASLSLLTSARNSITLPIAAIGGITKESASALLSEGADMLAVIHGIFGQKDIRQATRQLVGLFDTIDTPQSDL